MVIGDEPVELWYSTTHSVSVSTDGVQFVAVLVTGMVDMVLSAGIGNVNGAVLTDLTENELCAIRIMLDTQWAITEIKDDPVDMVPALFQLARTASDTYERILRTKELPADE